MMKDNLAHNLLSEFSSEFRNKKVYSIAEQVHKLSSSSTDFSTYL